ncbi:MULTISPECIES: histidinol-phosphate transaminase [Cyanophyceae]|uniref:histidinol-phosphate transaminase n=1 Tax=Cyanophyceae TaxID=3028117 RepID=UPI00016DC7FB|nr:MULTISPECIES: histidinol-phosphate transaminase [Cyanophyceae]ACA98518.1 histidinol-phosphate amidotransferase [Picosynechococcus sp. PCC 7002]ANV86452.1 histidinol-phosphate aminotransferase [Picosynechococcus sp. PCC 7117]SMH41585.1 histidinol-phosphate aminotransferase [Picosynechococcus sp. OG1]SMQ78603.1 histidinol-phosphate aminotransferase [Synechococcus sp. 7002]
MSFLRSDLAQLKAYVSHPGGPVNTPVDILDTNESPYDLPADLKEILAQHYQNQIATNRYPDGGHGALKEGIADYVNRSGQLTGDIQAAHISVGNGSDELIRSLLIATCLGGEGSILVAEPTFSMYRILAQTLGIHTVAIARQPEDFSWDLAAAQNAIDQPQGAPVRVVFVVHPNSPTGQCLTAAEISWLQSLPPDILVVVDEAYFEFSQKTLVAEVLQRPNWVILRTFSKAFRLAALRVGYAVGSLEIIQALEKVRLPYNLPSFSQAAARLALDHGDRLLETIPEAQQERGKLYQALGQLPNFRVWPSDANFLYGRLQPAMEPQAEALANLVETLKNQGTLIRHTGGGLRISVGTPAENQRTLTRLTGYLQAL